MEIFTNCGLWKSLPNWFEVMPTLPLSAKFKMVGNGVPYLLAKGIALDLYEWITEYVQKEDGAYSLQRE